MQPFALYIHIPFCRHKCPYCDFNTYALLQIPEVEYVESLLVELSYRAALPEWHGREVQSIFFGGGTPSLLSVESIDKILGTVCRQFPVAEYIEVSLEANPCDLELGYLQQLRNSGVNRLSIGAQSFNQNTLRVLGRAHTVEQIETGFMAARESGFFNINLDLIYGVPGQSADDFQEDLAAVVNLNPEHVAAYGLTIEKGTPFYQSYKRGTIQLPREATVAKMMETANSFLPSCGFEHYEISNFAERGRAALHNLAYWNQTDYLGLGAGAHSYFAVNLPVEDKYGERWSNFALPNKYSQEVALSGQAESWRDTISRSEALFEFFFLGLRKRSGVLFEEFFKTFAVRVEDLYGPVLEMLNEQELIETDQHGISLSSKGLLLADSVIEQFAEPVGAQFPPDSLEKLVANS
ncbi:MAG: radical SAM family heme chaperone HemW [Bdellovibrionales bacterium]|nr:radical SAM family heme chaperone HemW [Bdellovibrionales bacterium]